MSTIGKSLLGYEYPVLTVMRNDRKTRYIEKGCNLTVTRQLVAGPGRKAPKKVSPPRCPPPTRYSRDSLLNLERTLDTQLQERQAQRTGICPVRQQLYSQCFNELIAQVTADCAERGHLLSRVRNESQTTLAALQALCESGAEFGRSKALRAEQDKADVERRVSDLQAEIDDLKKQLREEELECESTERSETIKHESELNAYIDEIEFLKNANKQMEIQLAGIFAPYTFVQLQK